MFDLWVWADDTVIQKVHTWELCNWVTPKFHIHKKHLLIMCKVYDFVSGHTYILGCMQSPGHVLGMPGRFYLFSVISLWLSHDPRLDLGSESKAATMYSWGTWENTSVFYLTAFVEECLVGVHCLLLHKLGNPIVCPPSPNPVYTEKTLNKGVSLKA